MIQNYRMWRSRMKADPSYSLLWCFGALFGAAWVLLMNVIIDYFQGKWGLH